ncbi:RCC1 domain-containing protein [Neptuniibacter sp. QD37_11]|uniref:RCC1 domain-containing protein n=1 Tax=Neptuniibacter sp. QD37_11 TaxID=3398209 RepID=UPI0039F488D6
MKKLCLVSLLALFFASSAKAEFQYRVPMGMDFSPQSVQQSAPDGLHGVRCGVHHCLGVNNNTVWVVGGNNDGQLGLGDKVDRYAWEDTGFAADSVGVGQYTSYAILNSEVYAAGRNNAGQLGLGTSGSDVLYFAPTGFNASYVEGSTSHTLALSGGRVYATGAVSGSGLETPSYSFVDTGLSAESIAVGTYHSFAINNGNLYVTGKGSYGRMGTGSGTDAPSWVDLGISVDAVSAGHVHSLILKDGTVWSTGEGANGRTGHGDTTIRMVFTDTGFAADSIMAGYSASYAIQNGIVYSTGNNANKALVLNGAGHHYTDGFKSTGQAADSLLSAGNQFIYISNGGDILAGGNGSAGKLGQGDTTNRDTFVAIPQ